MIARLGIMGLPMADTRARFHAPSNFGGDVVIEHRVGRFGCSSFDVEHRPTRGEAPRVEAWETRVWEAARRENPTKIKSMKLPDEVIAAVS